MQHGEVVVSRPKVTLSTRILNDNFYFLQVSRPRLPYCWIDGLVQDCISSANMRQLDSWEQISVKFESEL